MAINFIDKIKPANDGSFPLVDAVDIVLPDGSRLSEQPIVRVVYELPPDAADHKNIMYVVIEDGDAL